MDRTRNRNRRIAVFLGLLLAFCPLIGSSPLAAAQTRTATTTLGITVERHAAIVLPADESGVARASRVEPYVGRRPVSASGNASPAVLVTRGSQAMVPVSAGRERIVVTVFEP